MKGVGREEFTVNCVCGLRTTELKCSYPILVQIQIKGYLNAWLIDHNTIETNRQDVILCKPIHFRLLLCINCIRIRPLLSLLPITTCVTPTQKHLDLPSSLSNKFGWGINMIFFNTTGNAPVVLFQCFILGCDPLQTFLPVITQQLNLKIGYFNNEAWTTLPISCP